MLHFPDFSLISANILGLHLCLEKHKNQIYDIINGRVVPHSTYLPTILEQISKQASFRRILNSKNILSNSNLAGANS